MAIRTDQRPAAPRPEPVRLTPRGRRAVAVTVALLVTAATAYALIATPLGTLLGVTAGPPCTLTHHTGAETASTAWTSEQAMTATTVAGVGTRIGATVNGVAAAVTDALSVVEELDPPRAMTAQEARAVYRALPDVATPDPQALGVAEALLGHDGGALTCVVPLAGPDLTGPSAAETPNELGLTPGADLVRVELRSVFGKQVLGGFAPEGVRSGHIEGSAHYEGRAVDVFFRPVSRANQRLGWQEAQWAVAHAQRLHVATVIFDRRVWTARRSVEGWRDYRHPSGDTDNPVLMHEDHVHVDVLEGG
jgi:hypothetical protein